MSEYVIDITHDNYKRMLAVADAPIEPVIRCRDCRAVSVKYGNAGIECWMSGEPFTVEPDGFCKWGERRPE